MLNNNPRTTPHQGAYRYKTNQNLNKIKRLNFAFNSRGGIKL